MLHRVSVPQNKCFRVAHIKKLDYKQNIQAIIYLKISTLKHIRSESKDTRNI